MTSEIRKDYLQDRYALIAPKRAGRFKKTSSCPFCHRADLAVIQNLYPAFSPSNPKAYGRQEVIVDTPEHNKRLADLSVKRLAELIKAYGERVREMKKDKKIKYILVFKNYGVEAGASKVHEHSQVIGMDFLTPHLEDKTAKEHRYQARTGRCVYCDIIKKEQKGPRKIYSDKNVLAFAPYASQYAYEARIFPRRHLDNVADLTAGERRSVAVALKGILKGIKKLGVPYNFYMHERVMDRDQHFYIKIAPRGAHLGGIELGTGLNVNPVPPEVAAKFYRANFKR